MRRGRRWLVAGLAAAIGGYLALQQQRRAEMWRVRNHAVRVLVIGAGPLGSTYAALLAHWGMQVSLVAHGARLAQLRGSGLCVQSALTRRVNRLLVDVLADVPQEHDFDLVLVTTDDEELPEAADSVRGLEPNTPVVVLHKAPVAGQSIQGYSVDGQALVGLATQGGTLCDGLLRVQPMQQVPTHLGEVSGADTQRLHQAAAILRRAGIWIEVERHIASCLTGS